MNKPINGPEGKSPRVPTLVIKRIDIEHLAVRFEQIGDRSRFKLILQRFRTDFLLAACQEHEGLAWWIVAISQQCGLEEFGKRNGLRLRFVEKSSAINTTGV